MYNIDTIIDETLIKSLIKVGEEQTNQRQYTLAQKAYGEAYARIVRLANRNPSKYRTKLIELFNLRAKLYEREEHYDLAIGEYREIISLGRILLRETSLLSYVTLLAHTSKKVAHLHQKYHNKQLAQYFFNEALEYYKILEEQSPYSYQEIDILRIHLSLIKFYEYENLFEHAKIHYKEALLLAQKLVNRGIVEYNHELGKLHCDLASLYFFETNFEEATEHYHTSLKLLKAFVQIGSEAYTESLAIVQNNLASIYASQKKYDKALFYYKETLPYLSSLAENNPAKYGHNMAVLFKNLASIYFYEGNTQKAEFFHFKSIELFEEFIQYNEQKYQLELASCIIDGVEYYDQHSLTLYNAEHILKSYHFNQEAEKLLSRISKLRTYKKFNKINF